MTVNHRIRTSLLPVTLLGFLALVCSCATGPHISPEDQDTDYLAMELKQTVKSGEYDEAHRIINELLDRRMARHHHEEARYLRAVCYHRQKSYLKAFNAFRKFVEEYPLSRYKVEKELFKMGLALIRGAGGGFLGIPRVLGMTIEGDEVLQYLIQVSPTGEYAADSQRIIAQYHFDQGDFELAQLEYQALLDDFPRSEWMSLAEYRTPLCKFLQSRGAVYDRKLLEDALKGFKEYERKHPRGTHVDLARHYAKKVHNMLAEKNFRIADFYLSDKRVHSSVFYFRQTIQDYPETEWAEKSVEGLKTIRDKYPGTDVARYAEEGLELANQ